MKPFGLALLFLLFALPAHAQRGAGAANIKPTEGGGGGGGGDFGGGVGGFSGNHIAVTQFSIVAAHGDPVFVPSSYMKYDVAVAAGQAVLDTKQKTLGEIAREYREAKERKQ